MSGSIECYPLNKVDSAGVPGIWQVHIRHPEKLNAMSRSMWHGLRVVFEQLQVDAQCGQVRCVIISGAGQAFCAGGDISEYPSFRFDAQQLQAFHENDVWGGLQAILACDAPVVASIEGACMGAGVEIAACCDIRLVAADAKFGAPIAKLGFPMAAKEIQLVGRVLNGHTVRRMLLEAAIFSADEIVQQGFAIYPTAGDSVYAGALQVARRIAVLAPQAARMTKQTLRACASGSEPVAAYAYANSLEHREGVMAFLEKRRPQF